MNFINNRLEVEAFLLASLLNSDGEFLRYKSKVSAEHFSSELHKKIFRAMLAIKEQGGSFDILAVKTMANLNSQESCDLVEVFGLTLGGQNADLYLKRLVELIAQEKIDNFKLKKHKDVFDAHDEMQKISLEINQLVSVHTLETKEKQIGNFKKYLECYQSGNTQRIKTPFPTLNNLLQGGFSFGSFILIGGVPGSGKTSFALQLALESAEQGFKTFFLEAEMPMSEIYERCCGILSETDIDLIRNGEADASDALAQALAQLESLPIEFYFDTQRTFKNLINQVELAAVNGFQIIFVDYLQLFADKSKTSQDEFLSIKRVSEALRQIALKYNIVLVVLSSLNRNEATASQLSLNSLYGSSQLGHDCSQAIILEGEQVDNQEIEIRKRKLNLRLTKNRTGGRGEVPLIYYLDCQKMVESFYGMPF